MNKDIIPDSLLPRQIEAMGQRWIMIGKLQNLYYRALMLPIGGGDPRWFSNKELLDISELNNENRSGMVRS